jgi:hypothetical protein
MTEKRFYFDAHWVKLRNGNHEKIIANVFNNHEAKELVELLNELFSYKLLVRKHKQDLEAIYGKTIKEQLKEVME